MSTNKSLGDNEDQISNECSVTMRRVEITTNFKKFDISYVF